MELYLVCEDLWQYVSTTPDVTDTTSYKKDQQARARICLMIKRHCLVHVRKAKSAKETWEALQVAYEDKGVNNRCRLLGKLVSLKLTMFSNTREYVTNMMMIAQQLSDIGKEVDDELLAALMLQGLPEEYSPMRMAIENSNITVTTDYVKNKLLQREEMPSTSTAFSSNSRKTRFNRANKQKKYTKEIQCFICGGPHKAIVCPNNPNKKQDKDRDQNKQRLYTAFGTMTKDNDEEWFLDSGASSHMTMKKNWLENYREFNNSVEIVVANGETLHGVGSGDVESERFGVKGAMYVPGLSANLLSVSTLVKRNFVVVFSDKGCEIYDKSDCNVTGEVVLLCKPDKGVYKCKLFSDINSALATNVIDQYELWHKRLAHLGLKNMKILRDGMATGVSFADPSVLQCVPCLKGKQTRLPFKKTGGTRAKSALELVHSDICGPMSETSFGGHRYFMTLIDDYTRKTFVYFLNHKSEVFGIFKDFKTFAETQTGRKLKVLRSDNGTEYVNKQMSSFMKENGILHQLTVEYTPEQNGVAERANRTIVEKARSMLKDSGLSRGYWAEAVNTAVFLKNRSPTLAVKRLTPEEAWTGRKVDLSMLRVFGCKAYMHIPDQKRKKWDAKSKELIFVGYCEESKAYRLLDPTTKHVYKARDVVFFENQTTKHETIVNEYTTPVTILPLVDNIRSEPNLRATDILEVRENNEGQNSSEEIETNEVISEVEPEGETQGGEVSEGWMDAIEEVESASEEIIEPFTEERRYPLRNRKPKDFPDHILYEAAIEDIMSEEPLTVQEALNSKYKEDWRKAIQEELDALKKNNTWILVKPEKGQNVIDSKWVLRIKNEVGNKRRFKARLVARGFRQKRGLDYRETFSPVVRHGSLRLLLALSVEYGLTVDHMDVKTAFLNGDLSETVYMSQPEGFKEEGKEDYVCLLKKSLYGLKQAPRQWNLKLDEVLRINNFNRLESEPCVYLRNFNNSLIIIAVYVDDLLIFWNNEKELVQVKKQLMKNFEMKDLGKAELVLGMRVNQTSNGIKLDQETYVEKLLKEFAMEDCKSVTTPLVAGQRLMKPEEDNYTPPANIPYQKLIGSLMYLAVCTRGDIAYAVSFLSQFNNCFKEEHWQAAKRVLRYLKGTKSCGLSYRKTGRDIEGFADADHGGDHDRKSYSGYVFRFAGGAISWESKKQQVIALSSTESEYVSLTEAAKEAIFLRRLMSEITGKNKRLVIYNDSQSAMAIAENPVHHNHTKHIDLKYHFIRDCLSTGVIRLKYLESKRMPADALTKALPKDKFEWCASWMVK